MVCVMCGHLFNQEYLQLASGGKTCVGGLGLVVMALETTATNQRSILFMASASRCNSGESNSGPLITMRLR